MWVILFESCDVVLGIQWLKRLGVVKWDFKNQVMEFEYKGQVQLLKGLVAKKVQTISSCIPLKDLQEFG